MNVFEYCWYEDIPTDGTSICTYALIAVVICAIVYLVRKKK